MKGVAESYLDKKITHAVVAAPVHFNAGTTLFLF